MISRDKNSFEKVYLSFLYACGIAVAIMVLFYGLEIGIEWIASFFKADPTGVYPWLFPPNDPTRTILISGFLGAILQSFINSRESRKNKQ